MNPNRLYNICATALAIFAASVACADSLRLANGDVLTGKLVSHEDGRIKFASPVLGVIEVDDASATVAATAPDAEPEAVAAVAQDETPPADAESETDALAKAGLDTRWKSKIDLGFNWQDGRKNRRDLNIRLEAERKTERNQYRAQGRFLLARDNGTTSTDRRDASLRWRREFGKRWFSQTNTTYSDDSVKDIQFNIDQNVGVGYRFLRSEKASASVGAGVTAQYRDTVADIDDGLGQFGEIFQDLKWKFHPRFELSEEVNALYSPDGQPLRTATGNPVNLASNDVPNYKVNFSSVLRGRITEAMTVNLRFEYEFDNAIIDRNARSDRRVTTSIGYAF